MKHKIPTPPCWLIRFAEVYHADERNYIAWKFVKCTVFLSKCGFKDMSSGVYHD